MCRLLSCHFDGWQVVGVEVVDTLLGPERTGVLSRQEIRSARMVGYRWLWLVGPCRVWVGVLFENCTVDASIFVSKCLRAFGGCLGTRSR